MIRYLSLILMTLFFGCKNSNDTIHPSQRTIKIGVVIPETGKYAVIGQGERQGMMLALDSINKSNSHFQFEVIFEDFASETKNVPSIIQKFLRQNVDAIITSTTAACEVASPILKSNNIIHFVISPDIDILSRNENNFRIYYNFLSEAKVLQNYIRENSIKSVALVGSQYSSIQNLINNNLVPWLEKENIQIVYKELIPISDRDFKNHFLKIKSLNPELIFLAPMTNQVELFTKQLEEVGISANTTDLLGSFTFNWKPKTFINTLTNYKIIGPYYTPSDDYFTRQFQERFKKEPTFDISYAYDNLIILSNLLARSKKSDKSFKEIFNSQMEYSGASGKIIFTKNNDTDPITVIHQIPNKINIDDDK